MDIKQIGIIGAGTMGNGIAQAFALCGYDVTMTDVSEAAVQRGLKTVEGSLDRLVKKEKLTAEAKGAAMARIKTATDLNAVRGSDLMIEAATENLELKLNIFRQLADRVIGMHFFNPVPVMQLVELIKGLQTSDATYAAAEAVAKKIGKTPVKVRNSPGFVVNRLLCPMINEAIFALAEGLASAEEIDNAMKLGANHPIGPLALCDLIGLDVELAVMNVLFEGFKDPKYRPAPLLVEMVEAGYLGRKTGRGFFSYAK